MLKIKLDLFQVKFQKNQKSKEFCDNCLNAFSDKKNLESHEEYGLKNKEVNIDMPEKGTFIEFKKHNRSIKVPFIVYDFESFIQPISGAEPDAMESFTNKIQNINHVVIVIKVFVFMKNFIKRIQLFIERNAKTKLMKIFLRLLSKNLKT